MSDETTMANRPADKLMIPGPVEVGDAVLDAMGAPVPMHYGSEWAALYNDTVRRLQVVFRTQGDVFLLVSSGSGGVEAAIGSLLAPGERALVAVSGFFSQRVAIIAQSRGVQVAPVTAAPGQPIDPEVVRIVMQKEGNLAALVVVHHETSTGILNPVRELGEVAREFNVPFVVDAVSSLGGEELAMDDWNIDICITASQKCLEAPPGLAPVAVGPRAWEVIDRKNDYPAGWYLNLRIWRQYFQEWNDWHPFPVTVPTNIIMALRAALDVLEAEGLEQRQARYRRAARHFRDGVQDLGFSLFADGDIAASVITAVRSRPDVHVADLVVFLRDQYGIRISGGMGELRDEIFRVGHMGKASSPEYVELLLRAISDYLSRQ